EDTLCASEARYRGLFENAPLMYVITRNEQGVPYISDCNELFLQTIGYRREEVLEKPLADFYTPESRAELLEGGGYARALAGEFLIGERHLVTRDGRLVPTLLYSAREFDGSGNVIGTRAMFVDITELKDAEQALLLRDRAIESSISGICLADLEGKLTYVNPAALKLWGYGHKDEVLGKLAREFWITEKEVEEATERALKTGSWVGELVAKLKDGCPLDVHAVITLVRDSNRKPIAVMGSFLDISERKQAQERLSESEERFRLAFENANIGVCLVDIQGRLFKVNDQMCEMFGYSRSELESMTVNDIAHPEDVDLSPGFIERAFSGEVDRAEFDKRYIHKKGHVVWGRVASSLVRDKEANPLYFISHVQDLTERK
ncbi:MAG: PAS domain S-box protein, partial [Deltaproteobacteria bacterium]|nr:PAS domain S-box protein [Deltaproteobacteria bacterium]